ncbi:hypothetical protein F2Q69_00048664 [Brassica cretica]|uniref:Secreted protein n=1 Tax=Brassica cretica TaxID=69181 RepID=A0A8S9PV87_BRACR|nr:hypothetical protein F2Q69_00048664 [Brassica cretica]
MFFWYVSMVLFQFEVTLNTNGIRRHEIRFSRPFQLLSPKQTSCSQIGNLGSDIFRASHVFLVCLDGSISVRGYLEYEWNTKT